MKVPMWVDLGSKEIEVEVSSEDIVASFIATEGGIRSILPRVLNNVAGFLNKLPDEEIKTMSESARRLVAEFFEKQAKRFRDTLPAPEVYRRIDGS